MESVYTKLNSDILLGTPTYCDVRFHQLYLEVLLDLRTACNDFHNKTIEVAFNEMEILVTLYGEYVEIQEMGVTKETKKTINLLINLTRPIMLDPRNRIHLSPDGCLSITAAWK